jgi:hypothetical protein
MNQQHRFVASLVVMSFVIFMLTLTTRGLKTAITEPEDSPLQVFELPTPQEASITAVDLPHPDDVVPLDDPMNLAVVVAVGLVSGCLEEIGRSYFMPVSVELSGEGVMAARIESEPGDVEGHMECIAARIWAVEWPQVRADGVWIHFSIPPTES